MRVWNPHSQRMIETGQCEALPTVGLYQPLRESPVDPWFVRYIPTSETRALVDAPVVEQEVRAQLAGRELIEALHTTTGARGDRKILDQARLAALDEYGEAAVLAAETAAAAQGYSMLEVAAGWGNRLNEAGVISVSRLLEG